MMERDRCSCWVQRAGGWWEPDEHATVYSFRSRHPEIKSKGVWMASLSAYTFQTKCT